jgi:hypothetical protein
VFHDLDSTLAGIVDDANAPTCGMRGLESMDKRNQHAGETRR